MRTLALILYLKCFGIIVFSQNHLTVYGTVYERDSLRDAKVLLYACQVEFEPYTIGGKTVYMELCGDYDEDQGQEFDLRLEMGYKYLIRIKDFGDDRWLECNYSLDLRKLKDFNKDLKLELNFHILRNCLPDDPDFKYDYVLAEIEYDEKGNSKFDREPKISWSKAIEKLKNCIK